MRGDLTELIEEHLGLRDVKPFGHGGRGCISAGRGYETSTGPIFVKWNEKEGAEQMFRGEYVSLNAIVETQAIGCPKPIGVFPTAGDGWALAMDYIDFGGSRDEKAFARCLARMHLYNAEKLASKEPKSSFIGREDEAESKPTEQFGFPLETCCGLLPQPNEWNDSWADFFIRNRLQCQIDWLIEKGDRDLLDLWPLLQIKASDMLKDCNDPPALVHGDLWSGNWDFTLQGPVVFDPSSFYADPEFEQGIMNMFGGLRGSFWNEYHKLMPKKAGREGRVLLYELFHHLNHWNHFGTSYKHSTIGLIHQILNLK